jgi:hypothetical protein
MMMFRTLTLTRLTALTVFLSLCASSSFVSAQESNPTMQDVLHALEQQDSHAPEYTNPHITTSPDQTTEPVMVPHSTLDEQTPPPAEEAPAPVIENINPALTEQTTTPQAPKAERAETPPTPPKPLAFRAQKFIELQTLDKVTARTATLTVAVGETVAIGPLFMQVKTCQRSAPYEQPESAAFLQVWEATPKDILAQSKDKNPAQWVFSGWMFASSPALSAMDHPIYDIWVLNCKNAAKESVAKSEDVKEPAEKLSDADNDSAESSTD